MSSKSFSLMIVPITIILLLQAVHELDAARKPKSDLANGQNCTNHLQTIDRCSSLATYSYTTSFNQYPQNAEEMKLSCDRITEGLKCLKTYGKCLSSFPRRSVGAYSSSRSRHSKKLCANLNDPKTVDFWKATECFRTKHKREAMVAHEKELISTIQLLATSNSTMKWEDRLHQACCAANNYKSKVLTSTEPDCVKFKVTTEDMVNSMIGELLDTACPEQGRLVEICSKLPKLALVKEWKAVSLTSAALELIVVLSDQKT